MRNFQDRILYKREIQVDFQICISVPLKSFSTGKAKEEFYLIKLTGNPKEEFYLIKYIQF